MKRQSRRPDALRPKAPRVDEQVKAVSIFDRQVGFVIWDTERRISREFATHAARLGVQAGLVPFLRALEAGDGVTQQEIADRATMRSSTTAKAVRELEALGYLKRDRSTDDARKNLIRLTKSGRDLCRRLSREAEAFNQRLLQDVGAEDARILRLVLAQIRCNLDR